MFILIEALHGYDEIILQDKNGIETVMDDCAKMKLRKKRMPEDLKKSYWIRIKEKKKLKNGFTLYDHGCLSIYNFGTRKAVGYEIINQPGLKIYELSQ